MDVTAGPIDGPAAGAYAAALSALPGMGPASLVRILADRDPIEAWRAVRAGEITRPEARRQLPGPGQAGVIGPGQALFDIAETEPGTGAGSRRPSHPGRSARVAWVDAARRVDPVEWWERFRPRGVGVTWAGQPTYPRAFRDDPQPPGVLFYRGDLAVLDRRCVAIVGTRNATPDGRAVAFEMGRDLAAAGICVVSGLALGIDGAAHTGAVAAQHGVAPGASPPPAPAAGAASAAGRPRPPATPVGPAGVAASGVDVPYPRRHAQLWEEVVRAGVVISETPPGRPAQAWRFPSRNRLIAALAELVVVVESHEGGGSLITAEAAMERGVEVRAVPGPVHSPASAGSNQLLYDGPGPVRHARDVLDALGIFVTTPGAEPERSGAAPPGTRAGRGSRAGGPAAGLTPEAASVLEALGWRPTHPGQVMARTALGAAAVARALDLLVAAGRVQEEQGWWTRVR